jgi:hypothetical protein
VDHVSKFKQQRSQEGRRKRSCFKDRNKIFGWETKTDTTRVSEIDQDHVSKVKEKHDTNHVSKVHQEHENSYLSLQLKHLVSQTDHVFEVQVPMLTI